jgi:hypothetical protein
MSLDLSGTIGLRKKYLDPNGTTSPRKNLPDPSGTPENLLMPSAISGQITREVATGVIPANTFIATTRAYQLHLHLRHKSVDFGPEIVNVEIHVLSYTSVIEQPKTALQNSIHMIVHLTTHQIS